MSAALFIFGMPGVLIEALIILWLLLVACGIVGFYLCRYRRLLLTAVLPVAFFLGYRLVSGIAYSSYGSGTFGKVGYSPIELLAYIGVGIAFVAPLAGAFFKRRSL